MSKTSVFTTITALPAGITRQSVIDMYHNHTEMIELNPLVVDRFRCKPPNYAPAEEFYSTWYTIKDKVTYLPGGLASGSVSYHAVFHDLPDGLQTHVYAPLGLDIRAKWSIGGSLPGEPKAPVELGIGAPREGLYIREDVRMKCNIMMMSFVKKTFKESHAKLVDRLVEKAHVLEAGMANERLKMLRNVSPGERMGHGSIFIAPPPGYQESVDMRQLDAYQPQPPSHRPHQSISSNGSGLSQSPMHSPGLSQASTLTSQSGYLGSPPQCNHPLKPQHRHQHSQECDHRGSFKFDLDQSRNSTAEQQKQSRQRESEYLSLLPATTYNPSILPSKTYNPAILPSTKYDPHQRSISRDSTPYHGLEPPPAPVELPCEDSPVLGRFPQPAMGRRYAAELPA